MVELFFKIAISLMPFLKEWFLGKPAKRGRTQDSDKGLFIKRAFIITTLTLVFLSVYIFDRLWTITKKYEELLKKEGQGIVLPPAQTTTPVEQKGSDSTPSTPVSKDCEIVVVKRVIAKKCNSVQDDYSEVIKDLGDMP